MSRFFTIVILILIGLIFKEQAFACSYDEKTSTFHGHGPPIKVVFGTHGIPSSVRNFFDVLRQESLPKEQQHSAVKELLRDHKKSLPGMRKQQQQILNDLKRDPSLAQWYGVENPNSLMQENYGGSLKGMLESMDQQFKKLVSAGASATEAHDAVMISTDPVQSAIYHAYKNRIIPPMQPSDPKGPKVLGIDNARSPRFEQLQKKADSSYEALIKEVKSLKLENYKTSELSEYKFFGLNELQESIESSKRQELALIAQVRTSNASLNKELFAELKRVRRAKDLLSQRAEALANYEAEEAKEMKDRDIDMAKNLLKGARDQNQPGLSFVGSRHKKNVLDQMIQECRMQPKSTSGPSRALRPGQK